VEAMIDGSRGGHSRQSLPHRRKVGGGNALKSATSGNALKSAISGNALKSATAKLAFQASIPS
jgi:hypothetical protein